MRQSKTITKSCVVSLGDVVSNTCIHRLQYGSSIKRKGKERKSIYIAPFILCIVSKCSHSVICKLHYHACISFVSFVSVHQMAPPLTKVADIQLQLTIYLSTSKG